MSNNPHRRRRANRFTPTEIDIVTTLGSALRGCTCSPDISRTHTGDMTHLTIAHDDDCPASNTGPQFALKPPHTPTRRREP